MNRTLIFTYGRFNPPTIGHQKIITKMKELQKVLNAEEYCSSVVVGVSRTQDKKKNPLDPRFKLNWLNMFFPDVSFNMATPESPSFVQMLERHSMFYNNLIFVCGIDRTDEYKAILDKYNDTLFQFKSYEFINLNRDSSDTAEGMSGSKMRQFVKDNDYKSFAAGLPQTGSPVYHDTIAIWNELRAALK